MFQSLAASIQEVGLRHPVVVRHNGRLIAGERRLRACELQGWKSVPVNVIDIDQITSCSPNRSNRIGSFVRVRSWKFSERARYSKNHSTDHCG